MGDADGASRRGLSSEHCCGAANAAAAAGARPAAGALAPAAAAAGAPPAAAAAAAAAAASGAWASARAADDAFHRPRRQPARLARGRARVGLPRPHPGRQRQDLRLPGGGVAAAEQRRRRRRQWRRGHPRPLPPLPAAEQQQQQQQQQHRWTAAAFSGSTSTCSSTHGACANGGLGPCGGPPSATLPCSTLDSTAPGATAAPTETGPAAPTLVVAQQDCADCSSSSSSSTHCDGPRLSTQHCFSPAAPRCTTQPARSRNAAAAADGGGSRGCHNQHCPLGQQQQRCGPRRPTGRAPGAPPPLLLLAALLAAALLLLLPRGAVAQQQMPFQGRGDKPPGAPVDVYVSAFVDRILAVNDRTYEFTAVVWFYLSWVDPRVKRQIAENAAKMADEKANYTCQAACQSNQKMEAGGCCDGVWQPYIAFSNLKWLPQDRVVRYGFGYDPRGDAVFQWRSVHATYYTPMDLRAFPFDRQQLLIQMEVPQARTGWSGGLVNLIPSTTGSSLFTAKTRARR